MVFLELRSLRFLMLDSSIDLGITRAIVVIIMQKKNCPKSIKDFCITPPLYFA